MSRVPNWSTKLFDFVADPINQTFVWGSNDCVLFAANTVLAITGVDHLFDLRGSWHDEFSAMRQLRAHGGLYEAVRSRMGEPLANPNFVQRGDIAMIPGERGALLAVSVGDHYVMPSAAHGLVRVRPASIITVWAVGR